MNTGCCYPVCILSKNVLLISINRKPKTKIIKKRIKYTFADTSTHTHTHIHVCAQRNTEVDPLPHVCVCVILKRSTKDLSVTTQQNKKQK